MLVSLLPAAAGNPASISERFVTMVGESADSAFDHRPGPAPTTSPSPSPTPAPPSLVPYKVTRHDESDIKIAGAKEAWTHAPANAPRKPRVLLKKGSQRRSRISKKGFVAHAGGLQGNKLVYQQRRSVRSANSQIRLYNTKRNSHRRLPARINTKHFEWAPVVQGRWLAFTRVQDVNDTARSVLWLANLRTGKKEVLEARMGLDTGIRSTQMAGRYLTWERCTHECEVLRYDRRTSTRRWIPKPRSAKHNYAPSVTRDGTVYFARSGEGCGDNVEIYRFTAAGGNEKLFAFPAGRDLVGSWAVANRDGSVRLYLDLVRCRTLGHDIYFVDIAG